MKTVLLLYLCSLPLFTGAHARTGQDNTTVSGMPLHKPSPQHGQTGQDSTSVQLWITDWNDQPIFGVYIAHKQRKRLLTTSDIEGRCRLNVASLERNDSIQFQGIGYMSRTIAWHELCSNPHVRLGELTYKLEGLVVTASGKTRKEGDLKRAMSRLKKLPSRTLPYCHYHGKAQYEKITEFENQVVEYRREFGYYFTSGDIAPRDVWDSHFRSYFVPAYSARSYSLNRTGTDTLSSRYMTTEEVRFDAGTRKLFTLLRAVQLYGPLFSGITSYEITPVDSDQTGFAYSFKTRTSDYPEKTRITCKGTLYIDSDLHLLTRISFDYIDYQLYRQILLSGEQKTESPFSTRAEIVIGYDEKEMPYIKSCTMETYWKHNLGENFVLVEQPSRQNPASGDLVEREAFACYDYQPMKESLRNRSTSTKIHLVQLNPVGEYDPLLFERLPLLLDPSRAIHDLSRYEDIYIQFEYHSDRTYYAHNFLNGFNGGKKNDEAHLRDSKWVRQRLFELFPPPTYP